MLTQRHILPGRLTSHSPAAEAYPLFLLLSTQLLFHTPVDTPGAQKIDVAVEETNCTCARSGSFIGTYLIRLLSQVTHRFLRCNADYFPRRHSLTVVMDLALVLALRGLES